MALIDAVHVHFVCMVCAMKSQQIVTKAAKTHLLA